MAATCPHCGRPSQTPAGWYPDPENPAQQRYWDGKQWSRTRDNDSGLVPIVSKFSIWSLVLTLAPFLLSALITAIVAVTGPWPLPLTVVLFAVIFSMGVSGFVLGINAFRGHRTAPGAMGKGLAITSIVLGTLIFLLMIFLLLFGSTAANRIISGVSLVVGAVVWWVTNQKLKQASTN